MARTGLPARVTASPCPRRRSAYFPTTGFATPLRACRDHLGIYLALTGRAIGPADAYRLGLATHCHPRRANSPPSERRSPRPSPSIQVLDRRHRSPGPGDLEEVTDVIARCFGADTVEEVIARLGEERGGQGAWAEAVARRPVAPVADLPQTSPTATCSGRARSICAPRWSRTTESHTNAWKALIFTRGCARR